MAVVSRAGEELLVVLELILSIKGQGIDPPAEIIRVRSNLRVGHIDVSTVRLGNGSPAIAVGVVLDGRLRVIRQYDLLSGVADGHSLEAVGEIKCASGDGAGGGGESATNNNKDTQH